MRSIIGELKERLQAYPQVRYLVLGHQRLFMKSRFIFIVAAGILSSQAIIFASDAPPIPFRDEGACPFECCTYRDWTVTSETLFYEIQDEQSKIAFKATKGETVTGVTGVVITLKPGKAIVKKHITLARDDDQVEVHAGDILYILHYEGEGYFKFWLHGKVYSDELPFVNEETESIKTETSPETTWWVQVRNSKGAIGWSKQTDHFAHMDACE